MTPLVRYLATLVARAHVAQHPGPLPMTMVDPLDELRVTNLEAHKLPAGMDGTRPALTSFAS